MIGAIWHAGKSCNTCRRFIQTCCPNDIQLSEPECAEIQHGMAWQILQACNDLAGVMTSESCGLMEAPTDSN